MNFKELEILKTAYKNDHMDTIDFKEKELDKMLNNNYLINKHKNKNKQIYWISEKGIKKLNN